MTTTALTIGCAATGQDHLPECLHDAQVFAQFYKAKLHSAEAIVGDTLDKADVVNAMRYLAGLRGLRVYYFSGHGGYQKVGDMKKPQAFLYLGIPKASAVIWADELRAVLQLAASNGDPVLACIDACHAAGSRRARPAPAKTRGRLSFAQVARYKNTMALGPCAQEPEDVTAPAGIPRGVCAVFACRRKQYALGAWPTAAVPPFHGHNTTTLGHSLATLCWIANMGRGVKRPQPFITDAQNMAHDLMTATVWKGGVSPAEIPNMVLVNKAGAIDLW